METYIIFKNRLKELMKRRGMTMTMLSDKSGIPLKTIHGYMHKKGECPCTKNIIILSRFFNVSTDYLLGLSKIKNPIKLIEFLETDVRNKIKKGIL